MMKQTTAFFWHMLYNKLWHKFNCFSLYRARKLNTNLFIMMILSVVVVVGVAYLGLLPLKATYAITNFLLNEGAFLVGSSVMLFWSLKDSRNAGITTIWIFRCSVILIANFLNVHTYIGWFDSLSKFIVVTMSIMAVIDIYKRGLTNERKLFRTY